MVEIIDADAHILEIEKTWDYIDPSLRQHRPQGMWRKDFKGVERFYWVIDGQRYRAPVPTGTQSAASQLGSMSDNVQLSDDSKFLLEPKARVRHMDDLGTSVQVLYPTAFLGPYTENPEVELAVTQSYNRFAAEIWETDHRLAWAAVLPLMTPDKAVEQLKWSHQHGACAMMLRGVEAGDRIASDPHFFPIYQTAMELDIPVCFHAGTGSSYITRIWSGSSGTFGSAKLTGIHAFHTILLDAVPDKFPTLRWGFIELSASWVPYALIDLKRRVARQGRRLAEDPLRANRIWVACQTNDDHEWIIKYGGDDNFVIGTDYGHADTSTEILAIQEFLKNPNLPESTKHKIVSVNAKTLYGF